MARNRRTRRDSGTALRLWAGRTDSDTFEAVMTREDRTKGFFVGFDYSDDALREIDAFFRKSGKVIVALTVREILDEQLAKKLV